MRMRLKWGWHRGDECSVEAEPTLAQEGRAELEAQPELVLHLLEPDQVVATKRHTRFGRRRLTRGQRLVLWSLRVYVVVMLAIVLLSVLRSIHVAH